MERGLFCLLALGVVSLAAGPVTAQISGVCPDGSMFIVQKASSIPCQHAKTVAPGELPPLRPQLLPRPYPWLVDQQLRDPMNPYNLVEAAEKIRAARRDGSGSQTEAGALPVPRAGAAPPVLAVPPVQRLALSDGELRDMVRLIHLRQQIAPAEFVVRDAVGAEELRIQVAHSAALEARVLGALRRTADEWRVVVFAASAIEEVEFHPNFFVTQDAMTFRPDPTDLAEVGMVLGEPGPAQRGTMALGYFAIPARFDPTHSLDLWWNDRSLAVVLAPEL